MQRRLDAHVAAFGEQNRDKIVAVPSNTGQGVHLYFDPERSLSPDPDQEANRQCTDSTEGVIVLDDSDSGDSSSDLGSDLDTVAGPDTPSPRGQVRSSSHLHAPKAPRHTKQENWREGSVGSSNSVHDSLALIAERKKALKAHLEGDVEGRRLFLEHERQKMLHQAENDEERIAILRRDYEGGLEQFRRENADIFGLSAEGVSSEFFSPLSPGLFESGDFPPEIQHPMLPQGAGPSRSGQGTQEDRKQHQQHTPLRRHNAFPFTVSPRDEEAESVGADGQFVVVARRVQKLGPCGTVVIDHDTGDEKLVTKRYRVREEELYSIDGDGDSVMGSDD
jgi:hypothetical protein